MMEEVDLSDNASLPQKRCLQSQISVDYGPPDPQIQIELERLNTCTDLINKLEVDLDEGRMMFRQMLSESTQTIDILSKKLGKCVEQARPYYDARIRAKQSMNECQKSAVRFERAVSQHTAAREMVQLAEEGLLTRGCIFDSTWQEMLNHATTKVNDAEREKIESTNEHREKSSKYHEAELQVKVLQKDLKRAISKSRPYFEMKAAINQRLEEQKKHIKELEEAVILAKSGYAQALINLETISDHIHKEREKCMIGIRGVGVGAESSVRSLLDNEVPEKTHYDYSSISGNHKKESMYTENQSSWLQESNVDAGKFVEPVANSNISSSWQFMPPRKLSGSNSLAVDDRESIISDTESLTSIEMLSEDAIANLMLDNDIPQVSESLGHFPDGNLSLTSFSKPNSNKETTLNKGCPLQVKKSSQSETQSKVVDASKNSCRKDKPNISSSQLTAEQNDLPSAGENMTIVTTDLKNKLNPEEQSIRPISLTLKSIDFNKGNFGSAAMKSSNSQLVEPEGQLNETKLHSNSSSSLPSNSSAASNCSSLSSPCETFPGYVPLEHSVED